MGFAWKLLLPLALVNIASAGIWVTIMRWGTNPAWTVQLSLFGISLLRWLETSTPLVRQLVALIVTLVINGAATRWLLQINQRSEIRSQESGISYQVSGTSS
jgi:hypothetical protein